MNAPVNSGLRASLEGEVARFQALMDGLGAEIAASEARVRMLAEARRAARQLRDQHRHHLAQLDEVRS